jgi:hypothetical protein
MDKKYYVTTYVVEILHDAPIPTDMDLKAVLEEAETGSYSGDIKSESTVEVDHATMQKLLEEQRSDPNYFSFGEE